MGMPVQFGTYFGLDTDQHDAHAILARGEHCAFDFGARSVVAPHGVQRNRNHRITAQQ